MTPLRHMTTTTRSDLPIRFALPKGRMQSGVFALFADAGIALREGALGHDHPRVADSLNNLAGARRYRPVSYTHLTLPTSDLV